MTIPSFKLLKDNASDQLAASAQSGRIVLIYAGIITAMSLLVTVINYALSLQIDQLGGLSNMGLRSVLSTIQSVLPMIQTAILMCLELGYFAAMLRTARRQYTSPQTLKLGFDRFWLLLRVTLIQAGIYMAVCMLAFWASIQVYLITRWPLPYRRSWPLSPLTPISLWKCCWRMPFTVSWSGP